jgi:2-polyprenyl-3-methyl-5-hydroxy-6-metoxy-1,4-benzoquinol methylase
MRDTAGAEYTRRLQRLSGARWKRLLDVQAPYRWNLRRLDLGRTLDLGCGIGRNLAHLDGSGAVGVDHNADSVHACRSRGLEAYTIEEFRASPHARAGAFDSLLAAHLMEHLSEPDGRSLLQEYLPYVRPGGQIVFITPQERGQTSDPTHVRFVDFAASAALATSLGLTVRRQYSFPFPRAAGTLFRYNEFVTVTERSAA